MHATAPSALPPLYPGAIPEIDYERHPAYQAHFAHVTADMREQAAQKFDSAYAKAFEEIGQLSWARPAPRDDPGLVEFLTGGVMVRRLDRTRKARILERVQPLIDEIRGAKAELPRPERTFDQCVRRADDPELIGLLTQEAERLGLLQIARYNLDNPALKIVRVWAFVANEADYAVTHIFRDIGLPDPKTVSMHTDSTYRRSKLFVYLNEVPLASGPLQFVRGSHRIGRSQEELATRLAMDRLTVGQSDPASRLFTAALPVHARRKGQFGNDVPDDHPAVEALLASEWKITSDNGDMILFDNGGIHRGALATDGERWALQIMLA